MMEINREVILRALLASLEEETLRGGTDQIKDAYEETIEQVRPLLERGNSPCSMVGIVIALRQLADQITEQTHNLKLPLFKEMVEFFSDGFELGSVAYKDTVDKEDPDQMDLAGGVIVYDESSVEPVNMAATKLVGANSMTAIRGAVLFGVMDEDGIPQTVLDKRTADWIVLFAENRCTVCGCADKPLLWPAFPVSNGRCCEKCDAVMRSVRSYMGIGNWKPREQK